MALLGMARHAPRRALGKAKPGIEAPGQRRLDANYRRVRRLTDLGSLSMMSALVDASGCASLLLYFLLYGLDG